MKNDVDAAGTPLVKAEWGERKAESKTSRTRVAAIAAIVVACLVLASAACFFLWEKGNPSRAARAAESSPALQREVAGDGLKPATTLPVATADAPFVNTLGMKFVPVPITGGPTVLFSVRSPRRARTTLEALTSPPLPSTAISTVSPSPTRPTPPRCGR